MVLTMTNWTKGLRAKFGQYLTWLAGFLLACSVVSAQELCDATVSFDG